MTAEETRFTEAARVCGVAAQYRFVFDCPDRNEAVHRVGGIFSA